MSYKGLYLHQSRRVGTGNPLVLVMILISGLSSGMAQQKVTSKMPRPATPPVELPSRLKYWDVKIGTGIRAIPGMRCKVHYTGWLKSGKKFDSSYDSGEPFEFQMGQHKVIKGWEEGIRGMRAGGKRILEIPSELGYGSRNMGEGTIPPNSTLIFEIEMLAVD